MDSSLALRLSNLNQLYSSYDVFSGHYVYCILLLCSSFGSKCLKQCDDDVAAHCCGAFMARRKVYVYALGCGMKARGIVGPVQRVQRLMK